MSLNIAVIGSTGLIGKQFLESIREGEYQSVNAITRRLISSLDGKPFINQVIHDFSDLSAMRNDLKADVLVCALGTTIKTAGSQEEFTRVDHDLPLAIARIAQEEGCQRMILISSVGASAQSSIFYSRTKGLLEEALDDVGFEALHILRPSMLLGDREESRPGEFAGKIFMKPLASLIPWKYRPIQAATVAAAIQRSIASDQAGKQVWEGKALFDLS